MLKIALIQNYYSNKDVVFPIGLSYLANALQGVQVVGTDPNLVENPFDKIKEVVQKEKPQVVAISIRNEDPKKHNREIDYFHNLRTACKLVKSVDPKIAIICGGAFYSLFPRECMESVNEIDYGIILNGEDRLPELIRSLRNPGKVKGVYYRDGADIKFSGRSHSHGRLEQGNPDWEVFPLKEYKKHPYSIGILSKVGCCFNCAYCTYPYLSGKEIRLRPATTVVDDIEVLAKSGNSTFRFVDTIFNVPEQHAYAVCQEIINRKLDVKWKANYHLKQEDVGLLELMEKAGCRGLDCSPDSYSDQILKWLQKDFGTGDISRSVEMFKDRGIDINYYLFWNPPGQTLWQWIKMMMFVIRGKMHLRKRVKYFLNDIRLLPHTKLCEQATITGKSNNLLPNAIEDEKQIYVSNGRVGWLLAPMRKLVEQMNKM